MSNEKQNEKKEIGKDCYINRNCWLVNNLNSLPYKRCQYCELKFRKCLFLQYQVISIVLLSFSFILFYIIDRSISVSAIIIIFTLVIVYGYFFNNSTEKIIKSNFFEKKAKKSLKELSDNLEERVKEQTKDIQKKANRMMRLLKMRSEFLDIASHQLRTPTSVIKGTLAMLKEGDLENMSLAERAKFIDGMYKKSIKLEEIINNILMASEMDTDGDKAMALNDRIDLTELADKIIAQHSLDAQNKKLHLVWQKPDEPMILQGSLRYIEEAINNLLDNAIKYTNKGSVTTTLVKNKRKALLTIQDTGIGIPKEDQNKVFKKFIRAKNARNAYTDGSGLGLFIVKEIIYKHPGAKIRMESKENKGTKFNLEFILLDNIK
ncbi:HAMP domain-containing histidine kinase [Patescibacteria group bacterium]|nr:HAMP domain-containing histidine kinase [Patescibacteria group bacterium]MBU1075251.1 HAMP domain-containing histidine kinase [Patescibacteria group bacterium]MBU1952550.1 HAMP domain-containing histidine kinase [Patescibacteria group bacterium]